ncbi:MAG: insulinase family protein [Chitinophagaceae bacterium]|nr:insulinase family protein [Chitinophagaceae bacterium]
MKKIFFLAIAAFSLQQAVAQVKIDRSQKPKAGPAPVIAIPDPAIFTLPNGITVVVIENHKLPRVRANFYIDAGPIAEGKKAGTLQLMGQMLEEGTTNMPKARFDEEVDIIGATVSLSSTGGSAAALTRYFDKAFSLMADAIKNPAFSQESLDKLKSLTITNLKSEDKNAKAIASRVVNALNYGKETARGGFITEESIKGITLEDIKNAYKNYITPSRSYLTFVGDIKPEVAKAMIIKTLGNWTGRKLPVPAMPEAQNPVKAEINFIDLPTAVQENCLLLIY